VRPSRYDPAGACHHRSNPNWRISLTSLPPGVFDRLVNYGSNVWCPEYIASTEGKEIPRAPQRVS
jgi:hypothetical protein